MPGTMPTVETVMWRQPRPPRRGSAILRMAATTASKFRSGSPMPMKTRVFNRRPMFAARSFRCKKLFDDFAGFEIAVQAKAGAGAEIAAHGAADLGGDAAGGDGGAVSGHQTVSTEPPASSAMRSLVVPSAAVFSEVMRGAPGLNCC